MNGLRWVVGVVGLIAYEIVCFAVGGVLRPLPDVSLSDPVR